MQSYRTIEINKMVTFMPFIFIFQGACLTQDLLTQHQGSYGNAQPESEKSGKRPLLGVHWFFTIGFIVSAYPL